MKKQINPAFSRLSFLVFHGEELGDARLGELKTHASQLRDGFVQLSRWEHPPTESEQGKEVFLTYATSLVGISAELDQAIERADMTATTSSLERIAKTCNDCHHFFRLDIEDSVVGPGTR